jgi:hypothetical protein
MEEMQIGPSYEDAMTVLSSIAQGTPDQQNQFLKSVQGTPTGEYLEAIASFVANPTGVVEEKK